MFLKINKIHLWTERDNLCNRGMLQKSEDIFSSFKSISHPKLHPQSSLTLVLFWKRHSVKSRTESMGHRHTTTSQFSVTWTFCPGRSQPCKVIRKGISSDIFSWTNILATYVSSKGTFLSACWFVAFKHRLVRWGANTCPIQFRKLQATL